MDPVGCPGHDCDDEMTVGGDRKVVRRCQYMTFKQFNESWWLWSLCLLLLLARGWVRPWDWISWALLGQLIVTGSVRIYARRKSSKDTADL